MKKILLIAVFVLVIVPFFLTAQETGAFRQEGIASWYGREFEGRPTASGEIFNASQLTAAHPTLPFGTMVVVTNQHNNRSVTVRINDRGPFVPARIIDVSRAAAEQLDMIVTGTAPVIIETVDRITLSPPILDAQASPPQVARVRTIPAAPVITTPPPVHQTPVVPEVTIAVPPPVQQIPVQQIPITPQVFVPEPVQQAPVIVTQPVIVAPVTVFQPPPPQFRIISSVDIHPNRVYRIQVGSFSNARNAVNAFDRLRNAGLRPNYERFVDNADNEFHRVVLAGIPGSEVQSITERLSMAGFHEAIIREE
ncbi:MAG: septal ring lytic transglycosylase RlpA family protein [Treponema sp.]|nr:septal ring lytic transglycosylase RlpA family protein [Treponema sp.]